LQTLATLVSRYWWAIAVRGAVAILFGVLAFAWPGATLASLVLLFGAYAIVDGIASVVMGVREYGQRERWWATLLGGLVSVGAGVVTFMMPGLTALTLLTVIALWAILRGVLEIVAAVRLRHVIEGEWLLGLGGALSILFGAAMIAFPGAGALAVIWWIGAYAIVLGVMLVALGFRARGLADRARVERDPIGRAMVDSPRRR
jgi:uncharacterized membrane protein HdeD (DUF308 family)